MSRVEFHNYRTNMTHYINPKYIVQIAGIDPGPYGLQKSRIDLESNREIELGMNANDAHQKISAAELTQEQKPASKAKLVEFHRHSDWRAHFINPDFVVQIVALSETPGKERCVIDLVDGRTLEVSKRAREVNDMLSAAEQGVEASAQKTFSSRFG